MVGRRYTFVIVCHVLAALHLLQLGACLHCSLHIADTANHRVCKVSTAGVISTVAGNRIKGYTGDDGPTTAATLDQPRAVAFGADGRWVGRWQVNCTLCTVSLAGSSKRLCLSPDVVRCVSCWRGLTL